MYTLNDNNLADIKPNQNDYINPNSNSCFQMYVKVFSDLLLKWSKKDGFYTPYQDLNNHNFFDKNKLICRLLYLKNQNEK